MNEDRRELFCILLPLGAGKLILPRSLVEEVRSLAEPEPEPVADMPPWLLGTVRWRARPIPLLSVEPFLGREVPARSRRSRMVVVRVPEGVLGAGALAILAQGFPYILRVTPQLLGRGGDLGEESLLSEVVLGTERPVVPDLPALAGETARLLAA